MSGAKEWFGFSVFYNDKKQKPSAPDYSGMGSIEPDVLDYIQECIQAGAKPELEVVGWMKTSARTGKKFQSLLIKIPYKVAQERANRPAPRQAPSQGQRPQPRQGGFPGLDDDEPIPF